MHKEVRQTLVSNAGSGEGHADLSRALSMIQLLLVQQGCTQFLQQVGCLTWHASHLTPDKRLVLPGTWQLLIHDWAASDS